jgi:hypothetical protein
MASVLVSTSERASAYQLVWVLESACRLAWASGSASVYPLAWESGLALVLEYRSVLVLRLVSG